MPFSIGKKKNKKFSDTNNLMPISNSPSKLSQTLTATADTIKNTAVVKGATAIHNANVKLVTDLGIIPPLESVPPGWWVFLVIITGIPIIAWVLGFSAMGWGRDSIKFAVDMADVGYYTMFGIFCTMSTLYILDFSYWESKCMLAIKNTLLLLCGVGFLVGTFFMAADYPYSPLTVFFLCVPIYLLGFRHVLFDTTAVKANFRNFISWLPGPLFFWAFVTSVGWLVWTFWGDNNEWRESTRDHYGHYVKCPPNFEGHEKCEKSMYSVSGNKWMCPQTDGKYAEGGTPTLWDSEETQNQGGDVVWTELGTACGADCANVYDNCLDAFMIWSTPFLTSLVYFILSFTFYFLNPEHKEASTGAFMKMFMIICFLFWVASSLAAGSADITSALMAFIMVALFAGSVVGIGIHGVKTFRTDVENNMVNKFREQYGAYGTFFKGMLVLTCGPIILFYWAIASVNQAIRKLGLPLTKTLTDEDKNFALTLVAAKQKEMIRGWKWTPVLTMAIKIGMFVQVMGILVTKFTYLGLAWLKGEISGWHWLAVSGMMICIGICLFLLPPVPGVPIYFVCGLMLVGVCVRQDKLFDDAGVEVKDEFGYNVGIDGTADMSLAGATFYCIGLGVCLKLIACSIQQKCIGEAMKNNVGIRQMCNVNSDMMRTMKVILSRPGLSMAKCSILIGGPDWPTSVMCGIMGLDLLPVLVGTIPVVCLIAPTVLSGLFVYMSSEAGGSVEWAGTLSTVCLSVTGMAQTASMILAAYYLEQAVKEEKDAIASIPMDKEVEEADAKQKYVDEVYDKVTEWKLLPTYQKVNLLVGMHLMQYSCYLTMLGSSYCFSPFEMTSSIDDLPGTGNPIARLVLTPGWIAIMFFCFSGFQLWGFGKWAGGKVEEYTKDHPKEGEESTLVNKAETVTNNTL